MTLELHNSLFGALPGDRRWMTRREGPFVHRMNPEHIAHASAAIMERRQLEWVDNIHRARRAKQAEEMLG